MQYCMHIIWHWDMYPDYLIIINILHLPKSLILSRRSDHNVPPCRIQVARLVPVVGTFRTCVQANSGRNMAIKDRF